jgi:alginate O-acetyltransferase complex protein AlgI
MIFSSLEYLLVFLPIALLGFTLLGRHARMALAWLVACSLFFYSWWEPAYLLLLLVSVGGNFLIARWMAASRNLARLLLIVGVGANLVALGWFKYAGFMALNLNWLFDLQLGGQDIVLPLAISFFTFQQIAFLVDCYKGIAHEYNLLDYTLFVSFFPQLIAGPIVHHNDVIPQFRMLQKYGQQNRLEDIQVGLTVLLIGLFKKVVIADGLAEVVTPIFSSADQGEPLTLAAAWLGPLCYTFQLYFDFSGYSDMAIGAARMFGIRMPENFNSPYKSTSIIDFWRRWHMTLSRFLQDYLYIPLGGNRKGNARRTINLIVTMLLGGLWHGAGWTFIFWGGLHASYLIINHQWRTTGGALRESIAGLFWYRALAWLCCFVAVLIAWVFFRAETFEGALLMLAAMFNSGEVVAGFLPENMELNNISLGLLPVAMYIAFFLPNTQEWMVNEKLVLTDRIIVMKNFVWKASWQWALLVGIAASIAFYKLIYLQNRVSEFIYFQF